MKGWLVELSTKIGGVFFCSLFVQILFISLIYPWTKNSGGDFMSLTDEIYRELCDGLEKGLDWQQFLAKHSASKGPLYNAIGRFFTEVGTKIAALKEEKNRVQNELKQASLTMDSLDQKIKEVESNIASLEDRENGLNGQVETLEAKLAEKSELVKHLAELEKLGFDSKRLMQLQEALKEIGMKHGLRGQQTVDKFFDDLRDYESVLGAELQLKGFQTQIETKKLEAENWKAKEEALKRKHDDLKGAIEAVHALRTRGIKASQIIAWHRVLSRFQTVEEFDQGLAQYGDMTNLLKAKKEETESYELRLVEAQSQVETLEKDRAKLEGAIDALRVAGVKELKAMSGEATKQLKVIAASEIRETQAVGQEVRSEFSNFFAQLDALVRKVFEIGQEFERTRQKLQKYEGVKAALESHAAASEADNEVPEKS
jgi:chromosome segregation ATPase